MYPACIILAERYNMTDKKKETLRKGRDYSELPERYIFYISRKDIWKNGYTVYEEENNMSEILIVIYHILALIFAAAGIVVLRSRSSYPDMKAGYHVKEAMKSKETWEYANGVCGKLCMLFTVVFLLVPRFLLSAGAGNAAGTAVLIIGGALAVAVTVLLPLRMLRRREK